MERREFLKFTLGTTAGAVALAAGAQAAPLISHPLVERGGMPPANQDAHPAVITGDELNHLNPEEVRWGRRWHRRWRRHRHWGWRRRHHWGWRRRHRGWHLRRWHHRRRFWHRRYGW